jgi:hypothetical protein
MQENLVTGVEKAHCQTCQAEGAAIAVHRIEVLDLVALSVTLGRTLVESAESVVIPSHKMMAKFAISETGSVEVLYRLSLNKNAQLVHEREVVHEQMTGLEKGSEIADHHQQHGAKVDHNKTHKTDLDHQDVSSKNDQLLSGLQPQQSKIASGVRK